MIEIDKSYDATKYEADIYKKWVDSEYFNPDKLPDQTGEPFSIIMPPPNVTGTLHVGHSLFITIQDILIRHKRMQGYRALWLPGTDHAAIATQSKVEKILAKDKIRRTDLGREKFLEKVEAFAQESHDTIVNQLKQMGASADWSREAYTLDEPRTKAVKTAFKAMYDDGLIYRADKVINWDPKGQTVISDDEIVHQEREATLYTFKYSKDFPISISTTRPETKLGDTAVAVHPNDKRYKKFINREYQIPFFGTVLDIIIIADKSVDKDFGTGALGVTPAHSMIDAEIAERHNLKSRQVIDEHGKVFMGKGEVFGKKVTEAREIIAQGLRDLGLMEKEETVKQNIATAERTGGIIEPLPKTQWFIAVNKPFILKYSEIDGIESGQEVTLKQLMKHSVESGQISISPQHFDKTYFNWIDNLRDWCISRQIWFGHQIPVWYKEGTTDTLIGDTSPGEGWMQDSDTLDTWFSSGLWTFSTLGWPEQTQDLKTFHPTNVLETGHDILFFWIARMILMSTYHTGQIPFKKILLHGMVRDSKNRKMSKSLGNIVEPLEMTSKYGTDALRFALVFNTAPGTDMALAEDKIKGMKHFGNKLWNISRFILQNTDEQSFKAVSIKHETDADKKIAEALNLAIETTSKALENFQMHTAAQTLYEFAWHELADDYLEASKDQLLDEKPKQSTQENLAYTLQVVLKLLHPFMPFITEAIWQELANNNLVEEKLLLVAKWPTSLKETNSK